MTNAVMCGVLEWSRSCSALAAATASPIEIVNDRVYRLGGRAGPSAPRSFRESGFCCTTLFGSGPQLAPTQHRIAVRPSDCGVRGEGLRHAGTGEKAWPSGLRRVLLSRRHHSYRGHHPFAYGKGDTAKAHISSFEFSPSVPK